MDKFDAKDVEYAEKRYREIKELGRKVIGVSPLIDPNKRPEWFQQETFLRAQRFIRKHYLR